MSLATSISGVPKVELSEGNILGRNVGRLESLRDGARVVVGRRIKLKETYLANIQRQLKEGRKLRVVNKRRGRLPIQETKSPETTKKWKLRKRRILKKENQQKPQHFKKEVNTKKSATPCRNISRSRSLKLQIVNNEKQEVTINEIIFCLQ